MNQRIVILEKYIQTWPRSVQKIKNPNQYINFSLVLYIFKNFKTLNMFKILVKVLKTSLLSCKKKNYLVGVNYDIKERKIMRIERIQILRGSNHRQIGFTLCLPLIWHVWLVTYFTRRNTHSNAVRYFDTKELIVEVLHHVSIDVPFHGYYVIRTVDEGFEVLRTSSASHR